MDRCYSLLEIKAIDDDQRVIAGIASTPITDRMGDIVEPKGAEFKLPIPLLWQHDSRQPIGHVTKAKVGKDGIAIEARIQRIEEEGTLRDRLDEAWQSIKHGLVRGLSIGFRALDTEDIPNSWGIIFQRWEWLELSAVTIPANADATIQTVKAADNLVRAVAGILTAEEIPTNEALAATGQKARIVRLNAPARDRAPFVIRSIKRLSQ